MKKTTKIFADGEIIFREGAPGDNVYVLKSGRIDLYKESPRGPVLLSTLKIGDQFGEMAAIDRGARSATAIAIGEAAVDVIPREQFLKNLKADGELALRVIKDLTERLRVVDRQLVESGAALALQNAQGPAISPPTVEHDDQPPPQRKRKGVIRRLAHLITGKKAPRPKPEGEPFVILMAPLYGDEENQIRDSLVETLSDIPDVIIKPVRRNLGLNLDQSEDKIVQAAALTAMQWLTQDNADALIWGGVDMEGGYLQLRFVNGSSFSDDHLGQLPLHNMLPVPLDGEDAWIPFLKAAALSSCVPRDKLQSQNLQDALCPLVTAARDIGQSQLTGKSAPEKAAIYAFFAHMNAVCGVFDHKGAWLRLAMDSYQAALHILPREAEDMYIILTRDLGMCLQVLGERGKNYKILQQAADTLKEAIASDNKDLNPIRWGLMNCRLAHVYYRLDLTSTAQGEPLKDSLAAYQSALQVFTRNTAPARWAEIMHNIGQVLQVYGDQLKSTEVLYKAIDACTSALEVRTSQAAPLLWAATQSNLGSAYFLLSKYSHNISHLDSAREAFQNAINIYKTHNAPKMVAVLERNMAHVAAQLQDG
jgi:CRP-like cAMP-binding protein/tetratricopeptide (TPR) repeat protein